MTENWKWKILGVVLAVILSFYFLVPSFFNLQEEDEEISGIERSGGLAKLFPKKAINLGLDLRGGMYLEMDVDLVEALKNRTDILISEIERLADRQKFPDLKLVNLHPEPRVRVELPAEKRSSFLSWLKDDFGDVLEMAESTTSFELKLTQVYQSHLQEMTLKQAEEAVRNRIDRYGVAEASILRQGDDRLIIELPGVKDPDRVIDIIRKTGLLEFKMVDDSMEGSAIAALVSKAREENKISEGFSKGVVDKINQALAGKIPEDAEVLYQVERDPVTKEIVDAPPTLLKKKVDVTGDMLRNAQVGISNNEPHVRISFNRIGTKNFAELTRPNVGKRLAIVLDKFVVTAPVIESPILDGEGQITLGYGSYDSLLKEAEDLALILREGALPATLTIATKTLIGPSLGRDSIQKGVKSLLLAALVVVLFMVFYYKWSGVLADAALFLNVLFIFAILTLFQASLTLPGIAGIVLTMGMAVDANIIIFERMREEARLGKSPRSVVESGYSHAMSAIVDANITTLISGIVLYQFGTGPIRGFATTLVIGILTTMFTAIVVTRLVYDYYVYKRRIGRISL